MLITPISSRELEETLCRSTGDRSPGLHMSDIYNDLYKRLEPKRYKGGPIDPGFVGMGLALEDAIEEALKKRLLGGERPGEFITAEGIAFSPDLIIFNGATRVGEIKLTWMSMREVPMDKPSSGFPPKFEKYFTQMKSYCHHLDTPYARLITMFINGDYKPPKPKLACWDIEFTAQELHENWRMLTNHGKTMGVL